MSVDIRNAGTPTGGDGPDLAPLRYTAVSGHGCHVPEAVPRRPLEERVDLAAIAEWTARNELVRAHYRATQNWFGRWPT